MQKISFKNDYSEGCHVKILESLSNSNNIQEDGYGEDSISNSAKIKIKKLLQNENAEIHFVSGGTQANIIIISACLRPYESVISATTGHINTHETGAIESVGFKINNINKSDGKLKPEDIIIELTRHEDEHMVKPRLVYISNSTELGTIYKKSELTAISEICKKNNLILFLDGARLGSALTSTQNDLKLSDIAKLVDVFYIGGTKNGALLGEAIVLINDKLKENFRYIIKQKGGLLAKGKILGSQFDSLFSNDLFFELANNANYMANLLSNGIKKEGFDFLVNPESNQIFPIFPNTLIEKLRQKFDFYTWAKISPTHSVVRLVTSWATKESSVKEFIYSILIR